MLSKKSNQRPLFKEIETFKKRKKKKEKIIKNLVE